MHVHVVDVSDRVGQAARNQLARQRRGPVIELASMSNGVTAMVDRVVKVSQDAGQYITLLAIWGHGGSGSMGVSRGTESERNADWAGIDIENLIDPSYDANNEEKGWAMRRTLRRLWDVLAWEAIVELRGCDVASGVRGQVFLTVLANIFEVKVRAGNVTQYGPGLGWAGTVHEARPNSSGTSTFQGQVAF